MANSKRSRSAKVTTRQPRSYNAVSLNRHLRALKAPEYITPKMILGTLGAVAMIGLIGAILLLNKAYTDPHRVFWAMINNNLATPGVTRQVNQRTSTESIVDISRVVFSPEPRVVDVQKRVQGSGSSATKLTLEGIGTPTDDYQHYSYIYRPGGGSAQNYDEVYKLWLLNSQSGGTAGRGTLFNNAAFGMVLFGNMGQPQRTKLVDYIKKHNVYKVDYVDVKKADRAGRQTYTYTAIMSLRDYAGAARLYSQLIGLKKGSQINPSSYPSSAQLKLLLTVDVISRELTEVVTQPSGVKIAYSSYGIAPEIALPTKVVDAQTFQNTLNKVFR